MAFGLYALGYLFVIGGVAYVAHLMHIPQQWIVAMVVILFGLGIVTGVQSTKHRDPS